VGQKDIVEEVADYEDNEEPIEDLPRRRYQHQRRDQENEQQEEEEAEEEEGSEPFNENEFIAPTHEDQAKLFEDIPLKDSSLQERISRPIRYAPVAPVEKRAPSIDFSVQPEMDLTGEEIKREARIKGNALGVTGN
jgi:hypothetical protein